VGMYSAVASNSNDFFSHCRGLKYNFQGGGTVQLPTPQFVPRAPFIFSAHISIAGAQIINDRLNVLSIMSHVIFLLL